MKKRKFEVSQLFGNELYWVGSSKRLAKKMAKKWSFLQGMDADGLVQEVVCIGFCANYEGIFETGACYKLGIRDNRWIWAENREKFKKS